MPRLLLPNGCSCTVPNVFPHNWKTLSASCKKEWYITYRFRDPEFLDQFPTGRLMQLKGMNTFKTVPDRRAVTAQILKDLLYYLQEMGYNPIRDAFVEEKNKPPRTEPIMPEDGLWRGIIFARSNKTYAAETGKDVDRYLCRFLKAAQSLKLHTKPLGEFRRRDMLAILDRMGSARLWTCYTYNNFLGYVRALFVLLNKYEAMELNPVHGIEKMELPDTVRVVLTEAERRTVNEYLQQHHHRFWLFINIFFHSGAREIELLAIKREDVDLNNQTFTITTRKGKKKLPRRETKAIKDIALPYWNEYFDDGINGEYVFCKGWVTGKRPLSRDWVTHLWEKIVKDEKDGLGIKADLYSLKHLNFDETTELLDMDAAAVHAGHSSRRMGEKHYAVKEKARQRDRIKGVPNSFG